jgi:integrase
MDEEGRCWLGGLNWRALSYYPLKDEFVTISRYLRFCSTTWGYINLNPERFHVSGNDPLIKRMLAVEKLQERDFFVHLSAAREWWQQQYGDTDLKLPLISKAPPKAKTFRKFPMTEEIWAVIKAETNPIYKCLWLAGAFGGLRISEQLNAWQVDILPGSSREHFFDQRTMGPTNTILFLRADPIESRYIDHPGRKGPTRRQHLNDHYHRLPRSQLPASDPLHAGWKGTVYSGEFLSHQVFWIDDHAAALFAECATEIRQFHRHHQTSKKHPWFYVNIADPTGKYRGDPVKISRVETAFEDAFLRVGLKPHAWGRNIHGLRHHYKWFAKEQLGIEPEHIQVMMGHRRIQSQDEYGNNARTTNELLSAAKNRST